MKIVAIVQARMGSIRFPEKVMRKVGNIPIIEILMRRLEKSELLDETIIATSVNAINKPLIDHLERLGYNCFKGSELDVLDRYVQASEKVKADAVVRITGDCPLVDPDLVDVCIRKFIETKVDYFSNIHPPTFPDGLDIEVIKYTALKKLIQEATKSFHREHVTPYIRETDIFSKSNYSNNENLSELRWTIDNPEDHEVISKYLPISIHHIHFGWNDVYNLYKNQPQLFVLNSQIKRNEGEAMESGQKLWKRAKRAIPGGNMLLSKRPEMFLPNQWPTYYSKAKGCKIWDLDHKEYIDMSIMGIGTNILGYGNQEVDEAVMHSVKNLVT